MQVKTFRGKSAEECFQKIKSELGRDAVILQSRSLQSFGKFGPTRHEVVAAIDVTIPADKSPTGSEIRRPVSLSSGRIDPPTEQLSKFDPPGQDDRYDRLEQQLNTLTANLGALTSATSTMGPRSKTSSPQSDGYLALRQQLTDAEVAEPLIKRLFADMPVGLSDSAAISELRAMIVRRLKTVPRFDMTPGKTRLVAFIGSTGVGKTTTIAKIAAQLALKEGRSVGIISMDTNRIAAAQQLLTYGEILKVPVKVAYNKDQMNQFLREFANERREVVLLDTAGRSPNDAAPIADMAAALDGIEGVYTYVVVPATLSAKNFENAIERFQADFTADALIVTKLDEAADNSCLGHLLNVQTKSGIPLTYFTNGQKVPSDLSVADVHSIASRLLSVSPN